MHLFLSRHFSLFIINIMRCIFNQSTKTGELSINFSGTVCSSMHETYTLAFHRHMHSGYTRVGSSPSGSETDERNPCSRHTLSEAHDTYTRTISLAIDQSINHARGARMDGRAERRAQKALACCSCRLRFGVLSGLGGSRVDITRACTRARAAAGALSVSPRRALQACAARL